MFRLALSSHIIFCFSRNSRHQSWHFACSALLVSLRPETHDTRCVFPGASDFFLKYGTWCSEWVIFCNLCPLAPKLALPVFVTRCWRVLTRTKQLSTVAILLYRVLAMLESRNVYHIVSALRSIVCLQIAVLKLHNKGTDMYRHSNNHEITNLHHKKIHNNPIMIKYCIFKDQAVWKLGLFMFLVINLKTYLA